MTTQTFFHVAPRAFQLGQDLLSWDAQVQRGMNVTWKWESLPEGLDGDIVSLFESHDEASTFQYYNGGAYILEVSLPANANVIRTEEGYPAVVGSISSQYVKVAA